MVGKDRDEYRPRRAHGPESDDPETPDQDAPEQGQPGDPPESGEPEQHPAPSAPGDPGQDETVQHETVQHEQTGDLPSGDDSVAEDAAAGSPSVEETVARARHAERVNELRQHREQSDPDSLPERGDRPDVGRRRNVTLDEVATRPRRRRLQIAALVVLLVAVVAATVALYVSGRGETPAANPGGPQTSASERVNMVSSDTMLTADAAGNIADQSWKVDSDVPGDTEDAPVAACMSRPSEGQPQPTTSLARTLTTGGSGPTALHRAEAYETPELATEAFALAAKAMGECNLKGSYIESGRVINDLGDQATGVLLNDPQQDTNRAVVLNRTGRVVNVVDVTGTKKTDASVDDTAAALAEVTNTQCSIAVGVCASNPSTEAGPPPIGGDQPGFLAYADLPLPKNGKGTWGGLPPGSPSDVVTSQCEDVDFNEIAADNRTARSYVLTDSPKGMPDTFGIDQIVLSMESKKAAKEQADQIIDNISDCEDRQPTADVGSTTEVSGTGANDTSINGSVVVVGQQTEEDEETARYRVGVATAGSKLIYTFLPFDGKWNVTNKQWEQVTVRAAERATQVR